MADKILHKRNLVTGNVPTTASLEPGELAINVADGKLFLRQSGSIANQVVTVGVSASYAATSSAALLDIVGAGDTQSYALALVLSASFSPPAFSSPRNPSPLAVRNELVFNGNTKVLQTTASVALTASQAVTASYVLNSVSSSFASTASKSTIQILSGLDTRSFALTMVESNTAAATNNPAPIAIHTAKP